MKVVVSSLAALWSCYSLLSAAEPPEAAVGVAAEQSQVAIVALGDSITRGVRSGVKPEETFATLVEARLKDQGYRATVANFGIGGERTDQALARLEQIIAARPRLVAVMYGTNDS